MKSIICFLASLLFSACLFAQAPTNPREFEMKEGDTTYVMKQYILVLLQRGETAKDITEEKLKELQAGHMATIQRLSNEGKLIVAGPFGDDGDLRGIFILDCATVEEAQKLVETDPMIQIGRLKAELHPWWTAKGTVFK